MKLFCFLLLVTSITNGFAQSMYQRDYDTLKGQRDKAVAAATDPINQKYKVALENIVRKATAAGDLDLALKVRAEIETLSKTNAFGDLTPDALAEYLPGNWYVAPSDWMVIYPDKTVFYKHRNRKWKIEKDGSVTITDDNTNKKASFRFDPKTNSYAGTDWNGNPLKGTRKD